MKKAKPQQLDLDAVRLSFNQRLPMVGKLKEEAEFILDHSIRTNTIKIHSIESRIKTIDSFLTKCRERDYKDPFEEIRDILGLRVICLFRSDLSRVDEAIKTAFEVTKVDDKVSQGDGFGYMSVHYFCKIPASHTGPRYEGIKDSEFEVQVRTLCMNAWAVVSHYLDYKGDWDVPAELKRALNALSGLFYIADNQFEQVYHARQTSLENALREPLSALKQSAEIDLDTLTGYMSKKFPDRFVPPSGDSMLVQQLKQAGFTSIEELDAEITRISDAFLRYEAAHPPLTGGPSFNAVGAVRISMELASKKFYEVTGSTFEPVRAFSQWK
jgi:ppGpp synthetase/RelA/SpoT-type nucleotidyltranferase